MFLCVWVLPYNSKTAGRIRFKLCPFVSYTKPLTEFNFHVIPTFCLEVMAAFRGFSHMIIVIRNFWEPTPSCTNSSKIFQTLFYSIMEFLIPEKSQQLDRFLIRYFGLNL